MVFPGRCILKREIRQTQLRRACGVAILALAGLCSTVQAQQQPPAPAPATAPERAPASAAEPTDKTPATRLIEPPAQGPEVRKLNVRARAPSPPALQYRLMPSQEDRTAGNAAVVYMS